jgi:hypothetical protein
MLYPGPACLKESQVVISVQSITPVSIRFISPINYESDENNEDRRIAKNAFGKYMYSELAKRCVGDAQIIFIGGGGEHSTPPFLPGNQPENWLTDLLLSHLRIFV